MVVQLWTDLKSDKSFNLALMKISAYHKALGDTVGWYDKDKPCDTLYCSKIFSAEFTADVGETAHAAAVIRGGTGYSLADTLPFDIEHIMPDYSIYGLREAVGFLTRGCPNRCTFCIVSQKEGCVSRQVAELSEFWAGQKRITLYDPNILACRDRERIFAELSKTGATIRFEQGLDARLIDADSVGLLKSIKTSDLYFAWDLEKNSERITKGLLAVKQALPEKRSRSLKVYVLVNFDTEFAFDVYRVEWLKANGFDPYVMVYNKFACHTKYKRLQRYANNKFVFRSTRIEDYAYLKGYI